MEALKNAEPIQEHLLLDAAKNDQAKEEGWADDVDIEINDDVVEAQLEVERKEGAGQEGLEEEREDVGQVNEAGAEDGNGWADEDEIDIGDVMGVGADEQEDELEKIGDAE